MKIKILLLLILGLTAVLSLSVTKTGKAGKPKKRNGGHKKAKGVEASSFLQTNEDTNSAFDDDLATEDKYDRSTITRKPYRDYNNEVETSTDDLMKTVKDDLLGEDVSYKFD
jgi:hypothetical protein